MFEYYSSDRDDFKLGCFAPLKRLVMAAPRRDTYTVGKDGVVHINEVYDTKRWFNVEYEDGVVISINPKYVELAEFFYKWENPKD